MLRKIKIWYKVLFYFITSIHCNKKAIFLDAERTKELIIQKRKSLIRLGDGEFNILKGENIHYQDFSKSLKTSLDNLINEYLIDPDGCNYLLCMPSEFINCNGLKLAKKRVYVSSWSYSRYIFKKKYDISITYGDAFLFAKDNQSIYSKIWQDGDIKNVIFVHNDIRYAEEFNKIYGIKTDFVRIPSKNAFNELNEILNKIIDKANNLEKTLILISAGPTGKVLVYELAKRGLWAIDTGHCWDSPLNLRM